MNVATLARRWQEIALWRLWVFALERDFEGVQFRGHQAGYNRGITFHKGTGGGLIGRLENSNPKSLITGFYCSSRQDQLTRFDRMLESDEMAAKSHIIFLSPVFVVMEPRHEM